MTPGTELCRREDVLRLYPDVAGSPAPAPVGDPPGGM
jgi:hypothetical protein